MQVNISIRCESLEDAQRIIDKLSADDMLVESIPGETISFPADDPTDIPTTDPNPPSPPSDVEVDRDGLPWDGRIHTSTRAMNKNGTWRNKRGVDEKLLKQVTAELKKAADVTSVPAADAPPPPVPAPQPAPAPEAAPAIPQATAAPAVVTFAALSQRVTERASQDPEAMVQLQTILDQCNASEFGVLATCGQDVLDWVSGQLDATWNTPSV